MARHCCVRFAFEHTNEVGWWYGLKWTRAYHVAPPIGRQVCNVEKYMEGNRALL